MELIKLGEKTFYIKNPTNIGVYKVDDNNVYLIDSGNDKDAGRKILKIVEEQGWVIKGIINTHSNADHIGGNKIIQDRTNCSILANNIECSFIKNPILEPAFLYGGFPFKGLRGKTLVASSSNVLELKENLPDGLEYFNLSGHFFDMIGVKTSDDVYFLGDALFSLETINKYHIFFIYDVREFLNTLNYLENLKGNFFVPSHVEGMNSIKDLIILNLNKVNEIIDKLLDICKCAKTFDDILQNIFNYYNLNLNELQYVLVGSTIKSYLAYLKDDEKIKYYFLDNKMYWETV